MAVVAWVKVPWSVPCPMRWQVCTTGCMLLWGINSVSGVEVSWALLEQQWQCLKMYHGSKTFDMAKCVISLCSCNHSACKLIPGVSCTTYLFCLNSALLALHSICRVYTTMIIWHWQLHHSFGLSSNSIAFIGQHGWLRLGKYNQALGTKSAMKCVVYEPPDCFLCVEGNSSCSRSTCSILSMSACCF